MYNERLKEMGECLSYARLTEKYFGKTRSWFAHKMNNDLVNGKPAAFSADELRQLAGAFRDIARKLTDLAAELEESAGGKDQKGSEAL